MVLLITVERCMIAMYHQASMFIVVAKYTVWYAASTKQTPIYIAMLFNVYSIPPRLSCINQNDVVHNSCNVCVGVCI